MTDLEAYWFLFIDSFVANIIFTFKGEIANKTMIAFRSYNKVTIVVISVLASLLANMINYILGRIFYNIYKASPDLTMKKNYINLTKIFKKYGSFFLLFTAFPFIGNIIAFVAGFIKFSINRIFVIIFFWKLLYYSLFL